MTRLASLKDQSTWSAYRDPTLFQVPKPGAALGPQPCHTPRQATRPLSYHRERNTCWQRAKGERRLLSRLLEEAASEPGLRGGARPTPWSRAQADRNIGQGHAADGPGSHSGDVAPGVRLVAAPASQTGN